MRSSRAWSGARALEAQKKLADEAVEDAGATLERERARAAETIAADKTLLAAVEAQRAERASRQVGEDALSMYDRICEGQGDGGVGGDQPEVLRRAR